MIEVPSYSPGRDAPLHAEQKFDDRPNQIELDSYELNGKNGNVYFVTKVEFENIESVDNPIEMNIFNEDGILEWKLGNTYDFDAASIYLKEKQYFNMINWFR